MKKLNCYNYVNLDIYGVNYWNDAIYDWTYIRKHKLLMGKYLI